MTRGMLYDLRLRIGYEYEVPAGSSRHVLRVSPRDLPGRQRAILSTLTVMPDPAERSVFVDAFGNQTHDVLLLGEHRQFEISLRSRIEVFAPEQVSAPGPQIEVLREEMDDIRSLGPDSPHHFLGRSRLVRPGKDAGEFAFGLLQDGTGVADAVRRIGEALHDSMTFDAKATNVDTPHEAAFAARRGVCQDFSHIMIAALRSVGIPAGYVSGFLRTIPPPGSARLAGADAMHAWVRAWCGNALGWFEYDPTNALHVSNQHVVVAYGRDYSDVSPIKGILRTSGSQRGFQQVDLIETDAVT